jgi:isopentenyl phosphate kinase
MGLSMDAPYEQAIHRMNEAIAAELLKAGVIVINIDPGRCAAETIGLLEMMEALNQQLRESVLLRPVPDHSK